MNVKGTSINPCFAIPSIFLTFPYRRLHKNWSREIQINYTLAAQYGGCWRKLARRLHPLFKR